MVSVEEAKKWVLDKSFELEDEISPLDLAVGRVLSQDVLAILDLPSFRNSSMDGYALLRADLDNGIRKFKVAGEIQAGRSEKTYIKNNEAYRIFTGAVIPENADIVIMQEATNRGETEVEIKDYQSSQKSNIREIGEQIRKGEVAMRAGHILNPASIGLLASFGISEVPVFQLPRIGILTTGNELKKAGEELQAGEIFESNSYSIKAALLQNGFSLFKEHWVKDDISKTKESIGQLLKSCHVLILSGGISVGKYDFVKESLEYNEVEEVFYKVNQKPGKPMYFGVKGEKLIFALPGNPASLLLCFYQYVLPALKKMMGDKTIQESKKKRLIHDFEFSGMRPEFLRGNYRGNEVEVLDGQSSSMLKSFAEANCLVYLQGEKRKLPQGSDVDVYILF